MTELSPPYDSKADQLIAAYQAGQLTNQQFLQEAEAVMWIIIAAVPDFKGTVIRFQDFLADGKAFIPVFSSKAMFERLTQGLTILPPFRVWDMRGDLLFSALTKMGAWIRINPSDPNELSFRINSPEPQL